MAFCPNCGANVPDGASFCTNCGSTLSTPAANDQAGYQQPNYQQPNYQQPNYQQPNYQQPVYQQPVYQPPVEPYSTGGLMAWSIITLLLCTIPGIVAIVQTVSINKATTVEEQEQKIKNAKIWCTVGTVLGVILLILSIIANLNQ